MAAGKHSHTALLVLAALCLARYTAGSRFPSNQGVRSSRMSAEMKLEAEAQFLRRLLQLSTGVSTIREDQDNREPVSDTTVFPYNSIGVIISQLPDGSESGCTGALIDSNYILTAAHCLHDPTSGDDIVSSQFAPGYSTDLTNPAPFGVANMLAWEIPTLFEECGDGAYTACHMKYDFGIMKIDTDYNLWMPYGYNNADTGNEVVNTAGYPGDLDDCFDTDTACVPYHVSCTDGVIQSGQSSVDSSCFTFHGQSGSPVWLYYTANSTRIIRGVLASAANDGGDGTFTLIDQDVFNFLQKYVGAL